MLKNLSAKAICLVFQTHDISREDWLQKLWRDKTGIGTSGKISDRKRLKKLHQINLQNTKHFLYIAPLILGKVSSTTLQGTLWTMNDSSNPSDDFCSTRHCKTIAAIKNHQKKKKKNDRTIQDFHTTTRKQGNQRKPKQPHQKKLLETSYNRRSTVIYFKQHRKQFNNPLQNLQKTRKKNKLFLSVTWPMVSQFQGTVQLHAAVVHIQVALQ